MDDYWKKLNEIYGNQGSDPGSGGNAPSEEPYRPSRERQPASASSGTGQSSGNPWYQPSHSQAPQQAPVQGPRPPYRPDRGGGEVSERTARLTITLFAASVAVLVIGLVVFFTVRTLRNSNDDNPVAGPGVTTPEDAARAVGGIGPPPGLALAPYIETRKTALAQAVGDRLAVVSLAKYSTEANARAVAGTTEVVALLAAAPGGQPSVLTGDVATWVTSQTADARAERDEINKLIPTVRGDPEFQTFYRQEVERLNKLISGIRPNGELVFGLVVRGPVPALQELGNKAEVRLVDIGPGAEPDPKSNYRGIRPEETEKANEPNTRPV